MASSYKDKVLAVASLARINLAEGHHPEEAEKNLDRFATQFADIVKLMDSLEEVDTSGVEPLYQPLAFTPASPREDDPKRVRTREEILGNAPEQDGKFFIVPKIV